MKHPQLPIAAAALLALALPCRAASPGPHARPLAPVQTVELAAARDATLIEDDEGRWANGSGQAFFAGRTSQSRGSVRRALLAFDLAGALPREAVILDARVVLHAQGANREPRTVSLHRVLRDWGEGPSSSGGGRGAPAGPGDATWLDAVLDDEPWPRPGGHFVQRASARTVVGDEGAYEWFGQALVRDVELALRAPGRSFGWILLGDETFPQTAKLFVSRESDEAALRPVLELTWAPRGRGR